MDTIDSLPMDDTDQVHPQIEEVVSRYFKPPMRNKTSDDDDSDMTKLKTIGMATIMFVLLNNEILENILLSFPSMQSFMARLFFKIVVFAIALFVALD